MTERNSPAGANLSGKKDSPAIMGAVFLTSPIHVKAADDGEEESLKINGIFFYWLEQGMEGKGAYAIQDAKFIEPPSQEWPYGKWSYDGLITLKSGDQIKTINADGTVFWEGTVELTDGVFTGPDQEKLIAMCRREIKGELIRA